MQRQVVDNTVMVEGAGFETSKVMALATLLGIPHDHQVRPGMDKPCLLRVKCATRKDAEAFCELSHDIA